MKLLYIWQKTTIGNILGKTFQHFTHLNVQYKKKFCDRTSGNYLQMPSVTVVHEGRQLSVSLTPNAPLVSFLLIAMSFFLIAVLFYFHFRWPLSTQQC
jgi:hypothetical protein